MVILWQLTGEIWVEGGWGQDGYRGDGGEMAGNHLFFVYSRRMENERMDIEGFKRLYEERLEALVGFCRRYLGDRESALDAAQEAFARLLERRDERFTRENAVAFLYITARNVCLDVRRRADTRTEGLEGEAEEVASGDFFLDEIARQEMIRTVREAVAKLTGRCRELAQMALEGKTNAEMAEELGITVNTVKSLKQEMYAQMRGLIGDPRLILLFTRGRAE